MPRVATLNFEEVRKRTSGESEGVPSLLHRLLLAGLCSLLIAGPLAFGAVEGWSIFLLQTLAAALFLGWIAEQAAAGRIELTGTWLYLPMAIYAALLAVQLALGTSPYHYAGVQDLMRDLLYALVFFLVLQSCKSREDLMKLVLALVLFGFALAVFAMLQELTSNGKIYWIRQPRFGGWFFGPYANRNHYAGLMEMLAPLPLVLTMSRHFSSAQKTLLGFAAVVMGASIFLSASRGGIVAFLLQLTFLGICMYSSRSKKQLVAGVGLVLVLMLGFMFWVGGGRVLKRFEKINDATRVSIAKDTLHMIAAKPLLGWGAGNYQYIYPQYRSFYSDKFVDHAHNDYLELAAETGLAGLGLALVFLFLLYRHGLAGIANWQVSLTAGVRLAALVACTGILVHSFLDFNLHIPANAAMFFAMAALVVREGHTRKLVEEAPIPFRVRRRRDESL